jgi:hypothetical protein
MRETRGEERKMEKQIPHSAQNASGAQNSKFWDLARVVNDGPRSTVMSDCATRHGKWP